MPRPKTACVDCGVLCYDTRCRPCFKTYMNLKTAVRTAKESWWVGVPREEFPKVLQAQVGRMDRA